MTYEGVFKSLKSLLKLVSQMVLKELSFKGMRLHRTKWTRSRLGGRILSTNGALSLDKVGERIKK